MTHVERMRLQAALQALRGALTVHMIDLCSIHSLRWCGVRQRRARHHRQAQSEGADVVQEHDTTL